MATPSPCVGFCRIDDVSRFCIGCARTAAEIAAWRDAPAAVLERIWSELPGRRASLDIGLHRLRWTPDEIQAFVFDTFRPGRGTWVFGVFGAVAEFCTGADEACEVIREGSRVTATTARGAARFTVTEEVRALAVTTAVGAVTKEVVVLAVPRGYARGPANHGLTPLGEDRGAVRPRDRADRLYDLGLGMRASGFCIRTSTPALIRELEGYVGRGWADVLAGLGGRIVEASPPRVVLNPIGRLEVFTPIPPPNGRSPDGPHTHLLPEHLAVGRETPPGLELPEAFAPCAVFYPEAGPASEEISTSKGKVTVS